MPRGGSWRSRPTTLLVAYDPPGAPVGLGSGVEMTQRDKGTEMFLYELRVGEPARRQGIGRSLVEALAALAKERACYDRWTGTDTDNGAARATCPRAGAQTSPPQRMVESDFGGAALQHSQ